MEEITLSFVVKDSWVVSSAVRLEIIQRENKVVVMGSIELNLHQLLHQIGLHLGSVLLVLTEE